MFIYRLENIIVYLLLKMSNSRDRNPQIFIARLPSDFREDDLDYYFRKYGRIRNLQLKRGYAFVEYDDYKDAEEQISECRQYTVEELFCCAYAPYFWQAIQIRYPEYATVNLKLYALFGGAD